MEPLPRSSRLDYGAASSGCSRENADPIVTNRILASSPRHEMQRLYPVMSRVTLSRGHVLQNLANGIGSLYFPLGGMIGLFTVMADGRTVVRAATGREGFIGVSAVLGAEMPPSRVVVLVAGDSLILPMARLQKSISDNSQFGASLRRYCSDYVAQVAQIGACHALHSVQQRVALWLLLTRDCSESGPALVTHELLSELLGCRRPSVSEALSLLEESGVIRAGRGEIEISDPSRLEDLACECYTILRARQTID